MATDWFTEDFFFLYLFVPFFVVLWIGVTSLLGRITGWYRLQVEFPDREDTRFGMLRFQTARLGLPGSIAVSYGNCLRYDVCMMGLRISVWRLFGVFCRPFFVPWGVISVERSSQLGLFTCYRLHLGHPEIATLTISPRAVRRIDELSRGSFRLPD